MTLSPFRLRWLALLLLSHAAGAWAQCTNLENYGGAVAPTTVGQTVVMSSCQIGTDHTTLWGVQAGATYQFSSAVGTDFLTIREGSVDGAALVWGTTPVVARATRSGELFLHLNIDASCSLVPAGCRTTRVTLLQAATTTRQRALNDSGQVRCFDASHAAVACSEDSIGETSDLPGQDARYGRDARAAVGALEKVGGGEAGFDFTRVCRSGEPAGTGDCPAQPVLGPAPSDWACTRDNVTQQLWMAEAVPAGWSVADPLRLAEDLVDAANTAGLCGRSDWRAPARRELRSIMQHGRGQSPRMDDAHFPVPATLVTWSADSFAPAPAVSAWALDIGSGLDLALDKFAVAEPVLLPVRLVSDDLAATCRAHLLARPGLPSGVYWIDPDGAGAHPPFRVRCDMTGASVGLPPSSDNGGWTLLAHDPGADFDMPFPRSSGGWQGDLPAGNGLLALPGTVLLDLLAIGELRLQLDGDAWVTKGILHQAPLSRLDSTPRALDCSADPQLLWSYDVDGYTVPGFLLRAGPSCGCAALVNTPLASLAQGTAGPGDANAHDGSGCWGVPSIGPVAAQVWGR